LLETPHQEWVVVHESDSAQDAVYLHAPGRDGRFPYDFVGIEWGVPVPPLLSGLSGLEPLEVGRSTFEGQVQYWLRPRAA
jgi:hypothetical protein